MIYPRFEEYNFSPWGHLERRKSPHSVIFQLEHRVDRPEDDPQAQLAMFPNILFQLTAMLDLNRQVAPPPSCHTIVLCVCVYVSQCVCVCVGGWVIIVFFSIAIIFFSSSSSANANKRHHQQQSSSSNVMATLAVVFTIIDIAGASLSLSPR